MGRLKGDLNSTAALEQIGYEGYPVTTKGTEMTKMIQLTRTNGKSIWLNVDHIINITPHSDGEKCIIDCSDDKGMTIAGSAATIADRVNKA
jgi:uncharacterized protein YlzI (FlbEa/FlbD family)